MATTTIAQILDAIEEKLNDATGLSSSQNYDELKESQKRADLPLIQVYPEDGGPQPATGVDQTTFGRGVIEEETTILVDLYATQRAHIGQDMKRLVTYLDAVIAVLVAEDDPPYFDLAGIKSYTWRWERVVFEYAGNRYVGARFTLNVRTF